MQMNNPNGTQRHPNRVPLSPRSEISLECLLKRLEPIYRLLRRQGFSDLPALAGRDAALDHGWMLLETGKANNMSDQHRAARLWIAAMHEAVRAARKHPRFVPLLYEPQLYKPQPHRRAREDDDPPWIVELWRAVDHLTIKERDAVLLHYVFDYPLRECGRIMGITAEAVFGDIRRARACLRKELSVLLPGEIHVRR